MISDTGDTGEFTGAHVLSGAGEFVTGDAIRETLREAGNFLIRFSPVEAWISYTSHCALVTLNIITFS
jgi:hypothetical protein